MVRKKDSRSARKTTARKTTARKTTAPSGRAAEPAAAEIPASFLLTTVEQLRSISVPVRLSILQALAQKAMTTKQVAQQLGEPVTRLYHHVDALARVGLIVLVEEVPKRGTVQRFYRAVASSFRADEGCFGSEETRDERARVLLGLLETTRRGIDHCQRDAAQANSMIGAAATLTLSGPGQAEELAELLTATMKQWARTHCSKKKCDRGTSYRVALFIHPEHDDA